MQTISALDFVNIAVSQDEGRHNMRAAYREKDRLVATDGHRLHMVSGLAMQEKGSFVDGRDCEFPNYELVFPKNTKEMATFKFNKKQIAQLNKIVKLYADKNSGAFLTFKNNQLSIMASEEGSENQGAWSATVTFSCETKAAWQVKLNLRYFVEALIPNVSMSFEASDQTGPQVIKADMHGSEYLALVMPLRY